MAETKPPTTERLRSKWQIPTPAPPLSMKIQEQADAREGGPNKL